MSHTDLAARVAYRFKNAAKFDGPHLWVSEYLAQIWMTMDSYGRVHHVTGDLNEAEKLLERFRRTAIQGQRDLAEKGGLVRDVGDIYIDGLPGGRNRMILSFSFTAQGKWDDDVQDAIVGLFPALDLKPAP